MAGILDLPTLVQRVRLDADTSKGEEQVQSATKRVGGAMMKVGAGLTAGLTLPIIGFASAGVTAASDLSESMSKVGTVFDDQAGKVQAFARTSATEIGISEQAALEATGTFGNLFRALGTGTKDAAEMSTALVTMAADLASFNNANPEDVLLALRSGLLGEAEPLRQFGVSLSAARIEAEALASGLVKPVANMEEIASKSLAVEVAAKKAAAATKEHGKESIEARKAQDDLKKAEEALAAATEGRVPELDAATKAQAAYAIIQKDTALAQGDFARTSDGLANQQRIMAAQFENAKASLGTALLPIMLKAVGVANSLMEGFKNLSPEGQRLVKIGLGIAAALGPTLIVMGKLVSSAQTVASGFASMGRAGSSVVSGMGRLVGGFRSADVAGSAFSGRLGTIGGALRTGVSAVGSFVASTARAAASIVAQGASMVASFVATAASAVASAAATAAAWLVAAAPFIAVGLVIAGVVVAIIKNWDTIKAATAAVWDAITSVVSTAVDLIGKAISFYFDVYRTIIETAWNVIKTVVSTAVEAVREVIERVFGVIRDLISRAVDGWKNIISTAWDGIKAAIRIAVDAVRSTVETVWNGITDFFGRVVAGWKNIFSVGARIFGGLMDSAQAAKDWVVERFRGIVNFVTEMPGKIASAASGMWDGIKEAFRGAINFIIRGWNNLEFKIPGFKIGPIGYDGFTLGVPNIPYLAEGGHAIARGMAVVGEAGPEIVDLPRGATVVPLTSARADRALGATAPFVGGNLIGVMNVHGLSPEDVTKATKKAIDRTVREWGIGA